MLLVTSEDDPPQWSPLVVSGMTCQRGSGDPRPDHAAMEPARGERDDPGELRERLELSRREGLRPPDSQDTRSTTTTLSG